MKLPKYTTSGETEGSGETRHDDVLAGASVIAFWCFKWITQTCLVIARARGFRWTDASTLWGWENFLTLSFHLPSQPGKKKTRMTWRTCSAGQWKLCNYSVPALEKEEEEAVVGNIWTDKMLSVFVSEESLLCTSCNTTNKQQCCSPPFLVPYSSLGWWSLRAHKPGEVGLFQLRWCTF